MSNFSPEPADPQGYSPIAVWQRNFKKWARQFRLNSVSGGKIVPDPNGGYHLVLPQAKSSSLSQITSDTIIPLTLYNPPGGAFNQFQIRDGLLAYRSVNWVSPGGTNFSNFEQNGTSYYFNNFEQIGVVFMDGQGYDQYGVNNQPTLNTNNVTLALTTDTLIQGYDNSGNLVLFGIVTMASTATLPSNADYGCSFWIQVIDDPVLGFYTQLYGRMWNAQGNPWSQSTPFPVGPTIFPIASARFLSGGGDAIYKQFATGNLINRYALGDLISRGAWSAVTGQVFYPNDWVYDDSSPAYLGPIAGTTQSFRGNYQYIGAQPFNLSVAPHLDNANWLYIGAVI